jgi:hypothetical protein
VTVVRVGRVEDASAVGRLLHALNEELGQATPSTELLAERAASLVEGAELSPCSSPAPDPAGSPCSALALAGFDRRRVVGRHVGATKPERLGDAGGLLALLLPRPPLSALARTFSTASRSWSRARAEALGCGLGPLWIERRP